ncbi:organic cation/carnitine transporter 2 [Tribolium castaneum]|uniref:organic cation/carnitine transporter 2 n=1 Tax=Tribolium castaneum TaxID=7070 RepID=UPI00046C1F72|nr:PREDICTED: solute carrier family 22 member 5 [Tribolium castaneum]|eukprot:XP_008201691.1 PREDICTED: solute carrier family 22 member 5 [Tribolium castaneum]
MFSESLPLVRVKNGSPPEELLATNAGGFGRWQVCVVSITLLCILFHGFDVYTSKLATPIPLNYTCSAPNSSRCFYANGTKCREFTFSKEYQIYTYAERFNLVCEDEILGSWVKNCFCVGVAIGFVLTGWTADRFGQKITAMVFIPLQCLLGVFLISITNFSMMLFFVVVQGICSTCTVLTPRIAVCEAVGNKWRTFMLAFVMLPLPIGLIISPYLFIILIDINKVVAVVSVLPLLLLVPILYFKDSPNKILVTYDFKRVEESVRKIAEFNKQPLPNEIRIRPVQLIENAPPRPYLCPGIWQHPETRSVFLAMTIHLFFIGFTMDLLLVNIYRNYAYIYTYGISAIIGILSAILMAHFIRHSRLIAIFCVLKDACVCIIFLSDDFHYIALGENTIFAMKLVGTFLHFVAFIVSDNITTRVFPTDFRAQGAGVAHGLFFLGNFFGSVMLTYAKGNVFIWPYVAIIGFVAPVVEVVCSFWLWDVHNRELPDFFEDAVNFQQFYKPVRYVGIDNKFATLREKEVRSIELNELSGVIPSISFVK